MIGYQVGATLREFASLRVRATMLILQVLVTALGLVFTLDSTVQSVNDVNIASVLSAADVTYFTISYDDSKPPDVGSDIQPLLARMFDGSTSDYTIIKSNFFYDQHIKSPVLVAMGGFAKVYGISGTGKDQDGVFIGSNVTQYDIGDLVNFGTETVRVIGRLPSGQAYLDPWIGYEKLDDSVLLLTTYHGFSAHTPAGVWQQEAVGRAVLFKPSKSLVTEYVQKASEGGGLQVVPQPFQKRMTSVYDSRLGQSLMFLVFFGCLLLVLIASLSAAIDSLVASNLRRYVVERLYGASQRHLILRTALFIALSLTLPAVLIFAGFSLILPRVAGILPIAIGAILLFQVALTARGTLQLRRMSLTEVLRKE